MFLRIEMFTYLYFPLNFITYKNTRKFVYGPSSRKFVFVWEEVDFLFVWSIFILSVGRSREEGDPLCTSTPQGQSAPLFSKKRRIKGGYTGNTKKIFSKCRSIFGHKHTSKSDIERLCYFERTIKIFKKHWQRNFANNSKQGNGKRSNGSRRLAMRNSEIFIRSWIKIEGSRWNFFS